MATLAFVVCAYLLGSLSFAVIVSRVMRLPDPHSYGSGNPGATNVLRTGNKAAAVLTLLGDGAKGWLAVELAQAYAIAFDVDAIGIALVALAAFLGHLWPIFHGFKGGKGVATAAGVFLGMHPWFGVGTLATWVIIAVFFRISSLAAIISAVLAPLWFAFLFGLQPMLAAVVLIAALLLWRHRENIRRLLAGTESRIGGKRREAPP